MTSNIVRQIDLPTYFHPFLASGRRPDKRAFTDSRPVHITVGQIGTARASSLVKLGHTIMVCGVNTEIAQPQHETPEQGYVVVNVELSPVSGAARPGPPSAHAQSLNAHIHRLVTRHINAQSPLGMCIDKGRAVWSVFVDVYCMNDDGNLVDAAWLAVAAALKSLTVPEVVVAAANADDSEKNSLFVDDTRPEKAFFGDITSWPLSVTFVPVPKRYATSGGTRWLTDPTSDEHALSADGRQLTLLVNPLDGRLQHVSMLGSMRGGEMMKALVDECGPRAVEKARSLMASVDAALAAAAAQPPPQQ